MELPRLPLAYPLAMLFSLQVFVIVRTLQPRSKVLESLSFKQRMYLTLAGFIGGSLGSKLPFVILEGDLFSLRGWLGDGKTITVALATAYLSIEIAKRLLGVRGKTGDSYAMPLAASMAVGRIGCLFYGCCYGSETSLPWGIQVQTATGIRHPIPVYESLFHASMFGLLAILFAAGWWSQHRLQFYLIAYCIFRFFTEAIRPEPTVALGMTGYQWIVLGFGLVLALQWLWEIRSQNQDPPVEIAKP